MAAFQSNAFQTNAFQVGTYSRSVGESVAASDTVAATVTRVGAQDESAAADDSQTGLLQAVGASAENAASLDTPAGFLTMPVSMAEAAGLNDAADGLLEAAGTLAETAEASDDPVGLIGPQIYNESVGETVRADDDVVADVVSIVPRLRMEYPARRRRNAAEVVQEPMVWYDDEIVALLMVA